MRNISYWGGVLDKARKVAKRGDFEEITLIMPLLKSAYEMLAQVKQTRKADKENSPNIDMRDWKDNVLTGATFIGTMG